MPIYNTFSKIFGRSPFKPLEQHMTKVQETVALLEPFIRATVGGDWQQAEKIQQDIIKHEHDADYMKRGIRSTLPESILLPVSRGDILALLRSQDKIANRARDIAGLILGRQMMIPTEIIEDYANYLAKSIQASAKAHEAISELDELLESAFSGKEVDVVEQMIHDLDDIEQETDKMQVKIRQKLFKIEKNFNPIDIMFLYKIIDLTGDLADKAQSVGSKLQLLIAK